MVMSCDLADHSNTRYFGPKTGFFRPVFRPQFDNWTQIYHLNLVFRWLMDIQKLKVISILKLYSGDLKSGRVRILNGGKKDGSQMALRNHT